MTKAELVDHVAATVQLPKSQTDAVLTQCLQAIMDALQAGEAVDVRGFGRFPPAPPFAADRTQPAHR
jgi:nucleoid DNA-binding protein